MVSHIITTCVLFIIGVNLSCVARKVCHDAFVEIWNDCYDAYGVITAIIPSYVVWATHFFPVCNSRENITKLIKCYEDVIAQCPETYREDGPAMMDPKGFRAFLIGLCTNKQMFENGKKCIGSQFRYDIFNTEVQMECITKPFIYSQWSAYFDNEWENYCRQFDVGMECVKNKTDVFGCDGFSHFVWYSSYARQPPVCRDNSSNYAWIDMYQSIPSGSVSWKIDPTSFIVTVIFLIVIYDHIRNM